MDSSKQLRMTVYASLFAALTAVGAFLAIPIGPVPIVLQNMFVYLAGLLLGARQCRGLSSGRCLRIAGICRRSRRPRPVDRSDRRLSDRLSAGCFSDRQNL